MAGRREQYIRMRVRVRDGQLSVVDSHLVDGPLSQTTGFSGGHAYEVTLDDRLLHAGHLADLGEQRSFVNPSPKAPKEQKGHHLTERYSYEFMARVPAAEVTRETIGRIAVRLHRLKEEARVDRLGTASAGQTVRARDASDRRARRPARVGPARSDRAARRSHPQRVRSSLPTAGSEARTADARCGRFSAAAPGRAVVDVVIRPARIAIRPLGAVAYPVRANARARQAHAGAGAANLPHCLPHGPGRSRMILGRIWTPCAVRGRPSRPTGSPFHVPGLPRSRRGDSNP